MKRKLICIIFCVFLIVTSILPTEGRIDNVEEKIVFDNGIALDRIITFLMKLGKFPSLSACIIKNNQIIWANGYGFSDIENKNLSNENTIYMVCSISKTITGSALMQLYDQGLFELDDDINDYLPFNLRNPNFPDDPITFRMLLSHSSSMRNDPDSFYWFNLSVNPPVSGYPHPWLEEYLVPGGKYYVPEIWYEEYRPGEKGRYANANFVTVAYLVELLSGELFIDYCEEHIFGPLGMEDTSFNLSDFDIGNVAIPYHFYNGKYFTVNNIEWFDGPPEIYYRMLHYPVGGLYTSVVDLSPFLIAHMNGGVCNGVRILEEDTVEEMHKIQPPGVSFGLAWYYTGRGYGKIFSGHEGDVPGYHSSMLVQYPGNDIGVIFFVTGDRYTLLGGFFAEITRNILFLKAANLDNSVISFDDGTNQYFFNNNFSPELRSLIKPSTNFLYPNNAV